MSTSPFVSLSFSPSSLHHCHFALTYSLLLLPSLPIFTYVLSPIFSIATYSRLLLPSSHILTIVTCSYLPISICFLQCHLFKSLICLPTLLLVCLIFELTPPLLSTSSPFYLSKRWRVGGMATTSNLFFFFKSCFCCCCFFFFSLSLEFAT